MMNTGPALRIAARSPQDEREAPTSTAAMITAEVGGLHAEWRRSLETVKATLAGLEQAFSSASDSRDADAAGLIEALVARAESEQDERQRQCQQQIAAAEAEAEALRSEIHAQKIELAKVLQQLDTAISERAKLQETFRLVQRALALGTAEQIAMPVEEGTRQTAVVTPFAPAEQAVAAAEVIPDPQSALMDAHPEAAQDINRVLDQVEAMYQLDLDSGRSGIEIVESLTTSLRSARSLVATRWTSGSFDIQPLFDYQIGLMLEREAGTPFGRHLGIAAYASRTPAAAPQS